MIHFANGETTEWRHTGYPWHSEIKDAAKRARTKSPSGYPGHWQTTGLDEKAVRKAFEDRLKQYEAEQAGVT